MKFALCLKRKKYQMNNKFLTIISFLLEIFGSKIYYPKHLFMSFSRICFKYFISFAGNNQHYIKTNISYYTLGIQYLKGYKLKLCKWLRVWALGAFWRQTRRQKTMPDMASDYPRLRAWVTDMTFSILNLNRNLMRSVWYI